MAIQVWFVPGFMGSTLGLYRSSGGDPRSYKVGSLWGDLNSLAALPWIGLLTLPGNLGPGESIFADGVAPSSLGGYSNFTAWMRANLPDGWGLALYPYDWRLSVRDTGRAFATALEQSAYKGFTNYVIAHSQGALVAWAAWAHLVDDGRTMDMTRLVTFAGALYGTNSTPSIFREEEQALGLLAVLRSAVSGFYRGGAPQLLGTVIASQFPGVNSAAERSLLEVVRTWPAVYDLYPDHAGLDDPNDTRRGLLYDPTAWTAALVSPDWDLMTNEVNYVHTWLRVAKYLPPPNVVSHIVGLNHRTPWRVQPANPAAPDPRFSLISAPAGGDIEKLRRRLRLPSYNTTTGGDLRATDDQQHFPGRYWQEVSSAHAAMQDDPAVRSLLVAMLQQVNPVLPAVNPVEATPAWEPPSALPSAPPFIFNSDPVHITPSAIPRKPVVRIGMDP